MNNFIDNKNLKYFIQDRYKTEKVIIDEWYISGWVIEIIWRTEDIPLLDKRTNVAEVNIRDYSVWVKNILIRTKKIKKLCSKLETK